MDIRAVKSYKSIHCRDVLSLDVRDSAFDISSTAEIEEATFK